MFGLDDKIATLSEGCHLSGSFSSSAILLGLRHATDPDHLAAMTSLVAGGKERAGRAAARLGLAWGLGHATTLFAFGLPIVVFNRYLPERAQQGAEVAIAIVIVLLAVRLIRRWRDGRYHVHDHEHDGVDHSHVHGHERRHGGPTDIPTDRARVSARSASVSFTEWAAAPASGFSFSPRSTRPASRWPRSCCSRSSRRCR